MTNPDQTAAPGSPLAPGDAADAPGPAVRGSAPDSLDSASVAPGSAPTVPDSAPHSRPASDRRPAPAVDRHMLEALVCPVSHGPLRYDAARQELVSDTVGLAFPIREGIPIMLVDEARQIKAEG